MDEEKESASICVLPEGCLSEALSLTSPRDACRAAAISYGFKSAADSDAVWERLLPPDYFQVIARAVSPVVFGSKKQLYLCLSESHILLDRGYLVCILRKVCWLEIRGKIAAVMLSQNTTYVAYLVFRIARDSRGLVVPATTIVSFGGIETATTGVFLQKPGARGRIWHAPLGNSDGFPRRREDGWMEVELGEFYCDEKRNGEVEMVFEEIRHGNWKN
ncbi:F-box domain, cyclin-like protein, partial [Cynara cardunculus var. scolymus]